MAVRFAGPAHSRRPGCSDPHPLAVEIHRGEERARIPGRGRAQDRGPPKPREEQDGKDKERGGTGDESSHMLKQGSRRGELQARSFVCLSGIH